MKRKFDYLLLLFTFPLLINAQNYFEGIHVDDTIAEAVYYGGNCGASPTVSVNIPSSYVTGLNFEIHITGLDFPSGQVQVNGETLTVGSVLSGFTTYDFYYSDFGTVEMILVASGIPQIAEEQYFCPPFDVIYGFMDCNDFISIQPFEFSDNCEVQHQCKLFPITASFSASAEIVDLTVSGYVEFENNSSNATSRSWDFGDGSFATKDSIVSHTYMYSGIFEVFLIVSNNECADTTMKIIEVSNTAGIYNSNKDNDFTVSPNPSNGNFTLEFPSVPHGSYEISDIRGSTILVKNFNGEKVYQVNDLQKGLYFLSIIDPSGSFEKRRIVVE